ncbi:MAG TPA: D-2-hydroxyacid dehydrogenase [Stellaceae bacterium]|nr:D-2-hydroxyacid dehydrogenase [Stellaceae bacterium]
MAKGRKTAGKKSRGKSKRAGAARRLRVHVTHGPSIVESQTVTPERMSKGAKAFPGVLGRLDVSYGDGPQALDAGLAEAEVLFLAGTVDLSDLKRRAPRLKWIQSMSAGVEKLAPLVPDGIALTNASGVHGPRGGEYGIAAVLMLNSRVPQFVGNQQKARWHQIHTTPLKGKTLLLLGTGAIGGEVARLAKGFGMRVLGVSRGGKKQPNVDKMYRTADLAKALPLADFVLSTLPLTPETKGLIGRHELDLLAPHAGIVNLGRAGVIDYEGLAEKLRKGELSGAVLDVFDEEPLPTASPLWSVPNLILSPHCAVDDEEAYVPRCLDIFFDNAKRMLAGKPLRNLVDTKLGY